MDKTILGLEVTESNFKDKFDGATIECETPNEFLYKFEGTVKLKDGTLAPMEPDQILLRGSSLRNTEWIIGVCVFTGHETKIMMNSAKAIQKKSKLEIATEKYLLLVVLIQFLVCLVAAVVNTIWAKFNATEHWYLDMGVDD